MCDTSGRNILRLVRKSGTYDQVREWKNLTGQVDLTKFDLFFDDKPEERQSVSLPKEFVTLTGDCVSLTSQKAIFYLANRGITKKDILKWKIGHCIRGEYAGRVIVPSFDYNVDLNYFVARTYTKDWKK